MDTAHIATLLPPQKRKDVYACDVIQSKLSRSKNRPSSTEGIAGRAVAAASWLGAAKASQAGRSLRTTLGGISSLALGLSGPHIGGISSWHAGAGHRWHTGAADHQMMEFCKPGLRGAAKIFRGMLSSNHGQYLRITTHGFHECMVIAPVHASICSAQLC